MFTSDDFVNLFLTMKNHFQSYFTLFISTYFIFNTNYIISYFLVFEVIKRLSNENYTTIICHQIGLEANEMLTNAQCNVRSL